MEKRRRYFIDKTIQASFLKFIVGLVIVVSCFFGFFLVRINRSFTDYIVVSIHQSSRTAIKPTSNDSLSQLKAQLDRKDLLFLIQICLAIIVTGLAISFWTIRFSHRVAGPVYRMKTDIDQVLQGNYSTRISLRKSDHLKDLASKINELITHFEETLKK